MRWLLAGFENAGSWCQVLNLVLIVLLPKPDGGYRPIGLFPTIIRVWMRARGGIIRAWENAHALPTIFGGTGMGAHKAAWQAAFAGEAATLANDHHLQALLDLVKAFEIIGHGYLAEAAMAKGYNIVILRLSLASYRLKRSISN